jgi:FMN phosphatase YigB (HAD superfamily)
MCKTHQVTALGKYRIISLTNNFSAVDPSNLPPPPLGFNQKYPDFVSVEAEIKSLGWHQGVAPPQLTNLFDDFCDSSLVGMRQVFPVSTRCVNSDPRRLCSKPEPEFYLAACRRNRVHPRECVFLDDLRM